MAPARAVLQDGCTTQKGQDVRAAPPDRCGLLQNLKENVRTAQQVKFQILTKMGANIVPLLVQHQAAQSEVVLPVCRSVLVQSMCVVVVPRHAAVEIYRVWLWIVHRDTTRIKQVNHRARPVVMAST
jgi:hypothetical protein